MVESTGNQYRPDYVSPPGETLLEAIEDRGMSQADLAARTGHPRKVVNEIIKGKAALTPETALELERVLGVPAHFWLNRERQYREFLARRDEHKRLKQHLPWLRCVPVRAMIRQAWIPERTDRVDQLREVLRFFAVVTPDEWRAVWCDAEASFRQSPAFEADPGAVAAWLRRGEIEAHAIDCRPFDSRKFREALQAIRALTVGPPAVFQPKMVDLCAAAGVAVVFVPALPKIRASGATRWLSAVKALIQLSLRYKTDDQLWFTFFHEAGHILKHGKREAFVEGDGSDDVKEKEASRFASDVLIPPAELRRFLRSHEPSVESINAFASQVGIAPGIVVGRLQHDGVLPYSHCNELKVRLKWAD